MAARPKTSIPLDFSVWMRDQTNKPPPPRPRDMADTSAAHVFHYGPLKPLPPPVVREVNPLELPTFDKIDPKSVVKPKYNPQADITLDKDDSYLRVKANKQIKEHISTLDKIEIKPPRPREKHPSTTTFDKQREEYIKPHVNNNVESAYVQDVTPVVNLREHTTSFDKIPPKEMRPVNTKALQTTYDKEQPVERPHMRLPAINPTYTTTHDKIEIHHPPPRITPSFTTTINMMDITETSLPHNWTTHLPPKADINRSPENRHFARTAPAGSVAADPNSPEFTHAGAHTTDDIQFTQSRSPPQKRMTFAQPRQSLIERPYYSMPDLPYYGETLTATSSRKPAVPRFARKSPTAPAAVGGSLSEIAPMPMPALEASTTSIE